MSRCVGCNLDHPKDTPCPDGTRWWAGLVECRICTHRHTAVVPIRPGTGTRSTEDVLRDLECPNCNGRSCDPVEEE